MIKGVITAADEDIFRKRSGTFYPSAKLFPDKIQHDVTRLYAFVRVADDYVDERPHQPEQLFALRDLWQRTCHDLNFDAQALKNDDLHTRLVKNIVQLTKKHGFENDWIESFFSAMEMDINKRTYKTLDDTLEYVYGSAEVVGLMMARIMNLPDESLPYAKLQGRAMQWINFIRDLEEDLDLGRCYFPKEDLERFGLADLQTTTNYPQSETFRDFVGYQLGRYRMWQAQAAKGFRFVPSQPKKALVAAVKRYDDIASAITSDIYDSYL